MKGWLSGILSVMCLVLAGHVPAEASPEMRAVWISRFDWASTTSDADAVRDRIRDMMETLAANNFNAVLFQIRGECNTLYPSPYEPWGPQFFWTDPGWDPLAYAIEQAHANNLEFHAYINTHTMTQDIPPAETTPQHLYNLHGPTAAESWVIHDESGNPVSTTDAYVWLSPGVPAAEAWTRRAIMHVVDTYDVDGIHFDRIRTPGAQYSHDPITEARFAGEGNPAGLAWGDFMRSQITEQLRRIYGATMLRKPHVKVSAAPFGICMRVPGGYQGTGTESYYSWYQDSFGWMQEHVVDNIYPMIYWDIGSAHPFEVLLNDFMVRANGRHVYSGLTAGRDYIAQIGETRRQGALGSTIFSYRGVDFPLVYTELYQEPAAVPEMPWKTTPAKAIIVGTVTDQSANPLTDAHVTITGHSRTYLSSADGFYAIIEIDPGTVTVEGSKLNFGFDSETVTVAAGDVIEVNLQLGLNPAGFILVDRDTILGGGSFAVRLEDGDLLGELSASVTVRSQTTGDEQVYALPVTGDGVFEGTVPTRVGAALATDGFVQVRRDDIVEIVYTDAFDGTGPATVTKTVAVSPEIIIDNNTDGFSVVGTWSTSTQGVTYAGTKRFHALGDGTSLATWAFTDIPDGRYQLDFWVNDNAYAEDAHYYVESVGAPSGGQLVTRSQYFAGDGWHNLGAFDFSGGGAVVHVSDFWTGQGVYVVADAMRLTSLLGYETPDAWLFQ